MPDNPSKLQNVQLPTESSDGLRPRVVEADGSTGGVIDGSAVTGAAEQNVEDCGGNCEDPDGCKLWGCGVWWRNVMDRLVEACNNLDSRRTQRDLP